ncbi:SIR2 family NAD-dependent protein deacylase [Nesterenkonia xinjiangensis]|uniref:NAD-dependent protein deacylase n=1 Tax=Nesterenkonia xinjiangensis TaxID=225327 RepID=A0A7Z0GMT1_9MICC|nr:NAD-dependent deacylase [Nesterenkonia xinjiangensis]NYJ78870.1 NAD-dependent deacetylase [Nesterenkonia xinjiangensis]
MRELSVTESVPEDVVALVRDARRVVVLSGAGISAESGVPTFREVQRGLWERFSAEELATPDAFDNDPALVWTWYRWRQSLIDAVEPNAGHRCLAAWQEHLSAQHGWLAVVTQNVDDLHERAGAEVLGHLHGSLAAHRCADCGEPAELPAPRYDGFTAPPTPEDPPGCESCPDGVLRPDVVWFGEMLPAPAFDAAAAAIRAADLVVVVGTSGIVQPAASLPLLGLERGIPLIEINPEETGLTEVMDFAIRGRSGEVLPRLLSAAGVPTGRR